MRDPYRQAGVDIEEADRTVLFYREIAKGTSREGVLSEIGHFAGLLAMPGLPSKVLVASADGVGTKLLLARQTKRMDGVGQDLVAMVVNDLLAVGARPLFLLDYLAVDRLDALEAKAIVEGVALGCVEAGCALLGGETAELPGMIAPGAFDLAGFAVGLADRDRLVTGASIRPGDVVLGLDSSGLHANGFSLVRKILGETGLDLEVPFAGDERLADALLRPTRIYVDAVLAVLGPHIHGLCHVTGGGIAGNLVRILPQGTDARLDAGSLAPPPVMTLLMETGGLRREDVLRVWNMGVGFLLVVSPEAEAGVAAGLRDRGERVRTLGVIRAGEGRVRWS